MTRLMLHRNKHDAHRHIHFQFGLGRREPPGVAIHAKKHDVAGHLVRQQQMYPPVGSIANCRGMVPSGCHLFDFGQGPFYRIDREHADGIRSPHIGAAEPAIGLVEKFSVGMNRDFRAVV